MKILFFTSGREDYLSDSLLLGFRQMYGESCVDFPKAEILYDNCPDSAMKNVRGFGFTLYTGLLEDHHIDRSRIAERVKDGYFDLIVISDIWNQYGWFVQLRPWLTVENTIVLDGADTTQPYPAAGLFWRRPYYWFLPRAHRKFLYFKRELSADTRFSLAGHLLPAKCKIKLQVSKNLRPTAFSFPADKIVKSRPKKLQDFAKHIVDEEVSGRVPGSVTAYAFSSETEYYEDLQSSRFGVTTKRAGWDCMRHYEIAANGAVPCFRDLCNKPNSCAPHGLDETNSISYRSADDLFEQLKRITDEKYAMLQEGAIKWVKTQTTLQRALEVINVFKEHNDGIRDKK